MLHVLAIVNSTATNVVVHVSFQLSVFVVFRYVPKSGISKVKFQICTQKWNFKSEISDMYPKVELLGHMVVYF